MRPPRCRSTTPARCRTSSSRESQWSPRAGWGRTGCSTHGRCSPSAPRGSRRPPTRSDRLMLGFLGAGTLLAALVMGGFSTVLSFWAGWQQNAVMVQVGRRAFYAATAMILLAAAVLEWALLSHDFSVAYVTEHTDLSLPTALVAAGFYGGQEGSLLYWVLVLGILGSVSLVASASLGVRLAAYAAGVMATIVSFFLVVLVIVASPFGLLAVTPPDGLGLNPILRDGGMLIHPPVVLAGFASFAIPFSFAAAALIAGRTDEAWIAHTRRFALMAWSLQTAWLVLGMWWAYHVLGWGGYWGWDPVENVALMPWLVGTAFIHSIQMQERRGMLKAWNILLIMVAFFLSIFGPFVVRSGILASVHAFALSSIGPYFLSFLALAIVGSLGLFFWRLPQLKSDNQLDSLLSRESRFLINNLLFLGIVFAIFWGTIYPLVAEALADQKVSVGPPYFKQTAGPLLGAVLLLMGIGPLMPWRGASREHLVNNFLIPVAGTIFGLAILLILGMRDPFAGIGFGLCLFVLGTILQEFVRGALARHHATGESYIAALGNLIRRNNRRYGGYVVHLAILLIGAGAVGSQVYQQQTQATLAPGQSVSLGNYTITANGVQT